MTDDITIYHNPACSTSRKTVDAVRAAGRSPRIVEYLAAGWTKPQLRRILSDMGAKPRDILRLRGAPAEALSLVGPEADDEAVLDAMIAHPMLVERPIVVSPRGTLLNRPVEKVQALL